jgi:hypothetical protein
MTAARYDLRAMSTVEELAAEAARLAKAGDVGAVDAIVAGAGGDRRAVEAARDEVAARLHAAVDDWDATAALTLLNRALSEMPRFDPLDWRIRWSQRFRRP